LIPLQNLSEELIETSAIQNAQLYSQAIAEFRTIYTSEVISKVSEKGITVSHDYHGKKNAIPLPATLSMMLGKRMGEKGLGGASKLYSPYPFPWREGEGGLRDDFAVQAWEAVNKNPEKPFYKFQEKDGAKVLHYATADVLRPSCVSCHNNHPDTPRKGWKTGDVRGVLQVSLPMENITAKSETGIVITAVYTMGVTLLILLLLAYVIRRLRNANEAIAEYSFQREKTAEELFSVIDEEKKRLAANLHDNIGQLISSAKLNLAQIDLESEPVSDKKKELNECLEALLNDAYREVKNLSYSILPEKLLRIGLANAISDLAAKMEMISEISIQLMIKIEEEKLKDDLKSSIYMMVQETLNNAMKHSKAKEVTVQLIQNAESVILMVEDNGKGFDAENLPNVEGLGIKNLYSRTKWLNGEIEINSDPGKGTLITIEYPL